MNDQELYDNYYLACEAYAKIDGNDQMDGDFVELEDDGSGKIRIRKWNHSSQQPTDEQLKTVTLQYIEKKRNKKRNQRKMKLSMIQVLSKNDINMIDAEDGMIVFNSTDKKVYLYFNGAWKSIINFGLINII